MTEYKCKTLAKAAEDATLCIGSKDEYCGKAITGQWMCNRPKEHEGFHIRVLVDRDGSKKLKPGTVLAYIDSDGNDVVMHGDY